VRRRATDVLVVVAVAVVYVSCAKLGLALAFRAAQVTAVWPPTGFALAAVLLLGYRRSVPGILIGAFLANATTSEPLSVATGIAIGNTLEAVVGAMLLRRLDFDSRLVRVRDVMALLAAVVVSPLVSATIGVISLGAGGVQPAAALPPLCSV
jgi:integral membrane sensor domain MASE1